MDCLGQGAYGMVKLAYKLDDPEKVNCSQWEEGNFRSRKRGTQHAETNTIFGY
jgi:hypothetical protein